MSEVEKEGYCIVKNALPLEFCDEILADIDRMYKDQAVPEWYKNPFHGYKTTRFYNLLNEGDVWGRLVCHDAILPVAKAMLGDDCLLSSYLTSIIGPEEKAQPIHVDDGPWIGSRKSAVSKRPHKAGGGPSMKVQVSECRTFPA